MRQILVCDQCGARAHERCQHSSDAEFGVQPEEDYLHEMRGIRTVYRAAFLVAGVALLALVAVSCEQERQHQHASYRALPSADERLMRSHLTVDEMMALQEEAVRREYGKIAAR